MTGQETARPAHTKTWRVRLDIFEEDDDVTTVHASLDTGESTLVTRTTARRNPHDPAVPEIGDEYATGRALLELGRHLLGTATADAAANGDR